ncbi:DNA repair protein RecN [Bacteroidota bacterium]
MLLSLSINNYALISQLDIKFDKGFSIITGETGAGKSILLGALSLILGQRADVSILKNKQKKCFVEGSFHIEDYGLQNFFEKNDLDYDNVSVIRREININGKSRAFINDTPVNLNVLKELGFSLVDIHSQHQNLILNDENFQIRVIDLFAGLKEVLEEYNKTYISYVKLNDEYNDLINRSEKAKTDLDYFRFQFDQLNEANLKEDEQEELESELEILNHTEDIKIALGNTGNLINGEENGFLLRLKPVINSLEKISGYFDKAKDLSERLTSMYIELKDISDEAELNANNIEFLPSRIEEISNRLDLIYNLEQKHHVSDITSLLKLKEKLDKDINEINSFDFRLEKTKKELSEKHGGLEKLASTLSRERKKSIPEIEKTIIDKLYKLGIPNVNFKINLTTFEEFLPNGKDKVLFMFSANKKTDLQEISKVASGGEISRLMLSVKSLISFSIALPTIIFDEIDSGVSGEIADKMGDIIKEMSHNIQVINITHLPQIARKGDFHYLVYKYEDSDNTFTNIKLLDQEERVIEIAKMLSGSDLTELSIKNARELLLNNK